MSTYTKFLTNNILYNLDHEQKLCLLNDLKPHINIASIIEQIEIELDSFELENTNSLPIVCYLLEKERNLIGPSIGSQLIINSLKKMGNQQAKCDILTKYDKTNNEIATKIHQINVMGIEMKLNYKPYKFQINLANKGFQGINNIICVRTGSGKTLIAALICKYWFLKRGKSQRVAFIVPTRYLAEQQFEVFNNVFNNTLETTQLKQQIRVVYEKTKPDSIRDFIKNQKAIVFLTAQKLLNTLNEGHLSISNDFDIIIFDECHHTHDSHPYNIIMNQLKVDSKRCVQEPLIIGLTASIGTGKIGGFEQILNILNNLNCKSVSYVNNDEDKHDLDSNISSPFMDDIKTIPISSDYNSVMKVIETTICKIALDGGIDRNKVIGVIGSPEFESNLSEIKQTAVGNTATNRLKVIAFKYLWNINLFYIKIYDFTIDYCLSDLETFLFEMKQIASPIDFEKSCINQLQHLIHYVKGAEFQVLKVNKKLEYLVQIVIGYHGSNSKGIILVRTRHHTNNLCDFLNNHRLIKVNLIDFQLKNLYFILNL
jgi:ERCC4-related helicase